MNECPVCGYNKEFDYIACRVYLMTDTKGQVWVCDRLHGHQGPHIACRRPPIPGKKNHCVVIKYTEEQEYITLRIERKLS